MPMKEVMYFKSRPEYSAMWDLLAGVLNNSNTAMRVNRYDAGSACACTENSEALSPFRH